DLNGLRLITLDTADTKYRCLTWSDGFKEHELGKLKKLLARTDQRAVWMIMHYPLINPYATKPCTERKNPPSLTAFHALLVPEMSANPVDAILSGDLHGLQLLHSRFGRAAGNSIVQFVAGNGGTQLDDKAEALDDLKKVEPPCADETTNKGYITCRDIGL